MQLMKKNNKIKSKKGFTFIEILVALVISAITILLVTQLSVRTMKLAFQNETYDKATEFSSRTSEALLKIRQDDLAQSDPLLKQYKCPTTVPVTTPDGNYKLNGGNGTPFTLTKLLTSQPVLLPGTTVPTNLAFQDIPEDTQYSRAISISYENTTKLMSALIVIKWDLYSDTQYFVNSQIFSLRNSCS